MKLSRQLLREMILAEMYDGESLAAHAVRAYGMTALRKMTEAELENELYTLMTKMGALDDNWPKKLDDALVYLQDSGAGRGQSVMGTQLESDCAESELDEAFGDYGFGQLGHRRKTYGDRRPDPAAMQRFVATLMPRHRRAAMDVVGDLGKRKSIMRQARDRYSQFTDEEIKKAIMAVLMSLN